MLYEYHVDGARYESERRSAGWFMQNGNEDGGGDYARTHPAGSIVSVYYDASNPEFSVLEPGWSKWSVAFSVFVWAVVGWYAYEWKEVRTFPKLMIFVCSRAVALSAFYCVASYPVVMSGELLRQLLLTMVLLSLAIFAPAFLIWKFGDPKKK
jgi:hypothetical protein